MNIDTAYPSKYLKAADLPESGLIWSISRVSIETVGQGEDEEKKPIVYFQESEQGLTLNKTNKEIIKALYGVMTEEWIGKPIVVYNDPTVMNKGQRVGGVRLRVPPKNTEHSSPSISDLRQRYGERMAEAKKINVSAEYLPDEATAEEIIAAGKALKAAIDKANEF